MNFGLAVKDQGRLDNAIEALKKRSQSSLILLKPMTTWVICSEDLEKLDEVTEVFKTSQSSLILLKPITTWALF